MPFTDFDSEQTREKLFKCVVVFVWIVSSIRRTSVEDLRKKKTENENSIINKHKGVIHLIRIDADVIAKH